MKCSIKINNDGSFTVKENVKLYNDLLAHTQGDIDAALTLYGVSLTDSFQELSIENPTINQVLSYVSQYNIENAGEITDQDRLEILNLRAFNVSDENFKDVFLTAFTENNTFSVNYDKLLQSGLFTLNELYSISNALPQIEELYYKLQNSEEDFQSLQYSFINGELFDKENPDLTEEKIIKSYAGLTTEEEIIERAETLEDYIVLETENGAAMVLGLVTNKDVQIAYEYNEVTDTVDKRQENISNDIIQSIDMDADYTSLAETVSELSSMLESEQYDPTFYERYLPVLEQYGIDFNIDFSTITRNFTENNRENLIEFFNTFYNVLLDIQTQNSDSIVENLTALSEVYSTFSSNSNDTQTIVKDISKNTEIDDMHIEGKISEESLFNRYNIIKVAKNTYRKVADVSLEDIYLSILNNPEYLPKGFFSVKIIPANTDLLVKELDDYVGTKSAKIMVSNSDLETVKKITAHKILERAEEDTYQSIPLDMFKMNIGEFLMDIKAKMLEIPALKQILYFSATGLQSYHKIGSYTKEKLKILLGADLYSKLVNYAKSTDNQSLSDLSIEDNSNMGEEIDVREYYSVYPEKLPNYTGNYEMVNEYHIINSTDDFVRIGERLFERLEGNVYGEVVNGIQPTYDGSIENTEPYKIGGEIKIKKAGKIEDETIEFC